MTRDEAVMEARRRWPHRPAELGEPIQHWGAVREGLFLTVGIGEFNLEGEDVGMIDLEIKGYGTTWEAAFAMADRAVPS